MSKSLKELDLDLVDPERFREEGQRVVYVDFDARGLPGATAMSDDEGVAYRIGRRYYVESFGEHAVEADDIREVILHCDLHMIADHTVTFDCAELGHEEIASLLYCPSNFEARRPVLINGVPYVFVGNPAGVIYDAHMPPQFRRADLFDSQVGAPLT